MTLAVTLYAANKIKIYSYILRIIFLTAYPIIYCYLRGGFCENIVNQQYMERKLKMRLTGFAGLSIVLMASCVDSDYDLDKEINKDISIFNNGIALPVGNVDTLKVGELLDLDNSDMIEVDAVTGEYFLVKSGTSEANFDIKVDEASITTDPTEVKRVAETHNPFSGQDVDFTEPQYDPEKGEWVDYLGLAVNVAEGGQEVTDFDVTSNDVPDEVLNFKSITSDRTNINMTLVLTGMGDITDTPIALDDDLFIVVPSSLMTDDPNVKMVNGQRVLDLTGRAIEIGSDNNGYLFYSLPILGWDVGGDGVDIVDNSFTLHDSFILGGTIRLMRLKASAPSTISLPMDLKVDGVRATIRTATGKFDPKIDPIEEFVEIAKDDLPDFLQSEDVCIDAAHASVEISLMGEIPMNFALDGDFVSSRQSKAFGMARIDGLIVTENEKNFILSDNGLQKPGFTSVTVDNLNGLLKYIPDNIDMVMNASADSENYYEIEINKSNNISIDYTFKAPLQFGDEMNVVYDELIDGWHGDLEDLNAGSLMLQGTMVYSTPVDVEIKAVAIDSEGNELSGLDVDVMPERVVKGDNELAITITDPTRKIIGESLDGIKLQLVLTNQSGNQETLKSGDYVVLKDLKLKLPEGIIFDGNSIF